MYAVSSDEKSLLFSVYLEAEVEMSTVYHGIEVLWSAGSPVKRPYCLLYSWCGGHTVLYAVSIGEGCIACCIP